MPDSMPPTNQRLSAVELITLDQRLPNWQLRDERLHRSFEFSDFKTAFAFMTRVADEAERLDHHPDWTNVYSRVDVTLWSHQLGGVSTLCVELAESMDRLAAELKG